MSEPITNRPANYNEDDYVDDRPISEKLLEFVDDQIHNVRWHTRMFIRSYKRVLSWIPIIWNDRDWDDHYLLLILRKKLVSIRDDSKNWNWVESEKQTDILNQCISDIDTLLNDEYMGLVKKQYNEFVDKYGELMVWDTKDENSEYYVCHFSFSKVTDQQNADEADQQWDKLMRLQEQKLERTRQRLWNTIRDHHQRWWD